MSFIAKPQAGLAAKFGVNCRTSMLIVYREWTNKRYLPGTLSGNIADRFDERRMYAYILDYPITRSEWNLPFSSRCCPLFRCGISQGQTRHCSRSVVWMRWCCGCHDSTVPLLQLRIHSLQKVKKVQPAHLWISLQWISKKKMFMFFFDPVCLRHWRICLKGFIMVSREWNMGFSSLM